MKACFVSTEATQKFICLNTGVIDDDRVLVQARLSLHEIFVQIAQKKVANDYEHDAYLSQRCAAIH